SLLSTVKRPFERELYQWNEPVDRDARSQVFNLRLQVNKAVFKCEAPFQHIWMTLDLCLAPARCLIPRYAPSAGARRNRDANDPGKSKRSQKRKLVRQIAKAFAEKQRGRQSAECVGNDLFAAGTANFHLGA